MQPYVLLDPTSSSQHCHISSWNHLSCHKILATLASYHLPHLSIISRDGPTILSTSCCHVSVISVIMPSHENLKSSPHILSNGEHQWQQQYTQPNIFYTWSQIEEANLRTHPALVFSYEQIDQVANPFTILINPSFILLIPTILASHDL